MKWRNEIKIKKKHNLFGVERTKRQSPVDLNITTRHYLSTVGYVHVSIIKANDNKVFETAEKNVLYGRASNSHPGETKVVWRKETTV